MKVVVSFLMIALQYKDGARFARAMPTRVIVVAFTLIVLCPGGFLSASGRLRTSCGGEIANGRGLDQNQFTDIAKLIGEGSLLPARARVEALLARFPMIGRWHCWPVVFIARWGYRDLPSCNTKESGSRIRTWLRLSSLWPSYIWKISVPK